MGIVNFLQQGKDKVFTQFKEKLGKMNGISTPFFGISWDNVTMEDKLNIICELYEIRKVLMEYTIPINVGYELHLDKFKNIEDNDQTLGGYLMEEKKALFNVFEQLEDQLYQSSAYVKLILLNGDKLEDWVRIFDYVRIQRVPSLSENDDDLDFEDIIELHNFIVKCKNELEGSIAKSKESLNLV